MNISTKTGLTINGHRDISFVDIDIRDDTPLYLDPYVIQALESKFCIQAKNVINIFFSEVITACQVHDKNRIRELLMYASEPNETNLGMKTLSDFGKGTTADELMSIFIKFYNTVRNNEHIKSNPLALCMYIKNFDKDKMSDLVTNIIRKQLSDFTIKQCRMLRLPLTENKISKGYYWDEKELIWKELFDYTLCIDGKQFLLVPKEIVRKRYVFNVECFIKQYILKNLQNEHLANNSDMCLRKEYADGRVAIIPPTRKVLYKKEVKDTVHKEYAFEASQKNDSYEDWFIKDIYSRIRDGYGSLSDLELDAIVYKKLQK